MAKWKPVQLTESERMTVQSMMDRCDKCFDDAACFWHQKYLDGLITIESAYGKTPRVAGGAPRPSVKGLGIPRRIPGDVMVNVTRHKIRRVLENSQILPPAIMAAGGPNIYRILDGSQTKMGLSKARILAAIIGVEVGAFCELNG